MFLCLCLREFNCLCSCFIWFRHWPHRRNDSIAYLFECLQQLMFTSTWQGPLKAVRIMTVLPFPKQRRESVLLRLKYTSRKLGHNLSSNHVLRHKAKVLMHVHKSEKPAIRAPEDSASLRVFVVSTPWILQMEITALSVSLKWWKNMWGTKNTLTSDSSLCNVHGCQISESIKSMKYSPPIFPLERRFQMLLNDLTSTNYVWCIQRSLHHSQTSNG